MLKRETDYRVYYTEGGLNVLNKRETDYGVYYTEEGEELQLIPNLIEIILYNLKRVGCTNVQDEGESFEDEGVVYNCFSFSYAGEMFEGMLNENLREIKVGNLFEIDCYGKEDHYFKLRLDLPPLNKVALTATRTEELTEALASEEEWIRKLAQNRFEELTKKEE